MPFISYAQNFEDVMLWRALRQIDKGFYIDVGAQSADLDSVTRAFSERGWRGINIEPHPMYFGLLLERRPRDINLCIAVGDHIGALTMNFVEATGLSTADDGIAANHAASGYALTRAEVNLSTLASVWADHVPPDQDVHFLKVDVEGLEAAVLAGNDWTCNRPWIVVVEATLPNSQTESHLEWEDGLLRANYLHVYSDGLNRYYVAREHEELSHAFKYPPNVFDDFVTAGLQTCRDQLDKAGAELAEARARVAVSERTWSEWQRRIELAEAGAIEARARERQASTEASELRRALDVRDRLVMEANHRAEEMGRQYHAVLTSTSWRLTSPLRRVASAVPRSIWRHGRRVAKAAWWSVTPWRLPERLRFVRERSASGLQAQRGVESDTLPMLDLMSDAALVQATGLSRDELLWPAQSADAIVDIWSAARFCIDMLRARADLRERFPKALSEPEASGFARWLTIDDGNSLGLTELARDELQKVLRQDIGADARQMFMFRADVRARLPHGLTPPGQSELFKWFMCDGRRELQLKSEEILWLFMQAAENPALELVRAFLFTPAWQQLHPDALTVFGRKAFAEWFAASYRVTSAGWLDAATWPVDPSPARQLRQAYFARADWQTRHPGAFGSPAAAASFLAWLQSGDASLSIEAHAWCSSLDIQEVAAELSVGGVNMIAHFCCPSGVRVSAEALVAGMTDLGIPTSLRDLRTDVKDEPNHVRFQGLEDFDITVIHTQPEPFFSDAYARSDLCERTPRTYRIAYWYWEFDAVPESWIGHAAGVDEVWAATEFVAKGLRERLTVPVKTLFPGVRLGAYTRRKREYFGLQDGVFTFLFNFHMNSVMERKNPLGLIRAFKQAFRPEEAVALVVKTMFGHHHPAQLAALHQAAAGCNVQIIDQVYDFDEVLSLTDVCDAYVSLHRSEGLGLTMAEAMLMGKPVIATNYSGNVDFMNNDNSLLVPYELVRLGRPLPPYEADLMWAEPSIEHAAALMRRLFDEPAWARELGAKAKASAEATLSVRAAGVKVAQRLAEIKSQRSAPQARA